MSRFPDITYHVQIHHDTKIVSVTTLGINSVDSETIGAYASVNKLPAWMQDKLATLMMLDIPPPLNDVDGVGSRLGPYLYWVYK